MPRKDTYSGPISAQAQQDLVSEGIENFELPKSIVMKIAKSSIPDNVKLQKETVLSLVKGSTVFINYLAATAHDVAQSKQHKSISASDVLKALEMLEFGDMATKLTGELQIYRDLLKADSNNGKGKKGASNGGSSASVKKASGVGAGTSASAPPKGSSSKGKEKAGPASTLPPPFTSTPLDISASHARVGGAVGGGESVSGAGVPMDVDDEYPDVSGRDGDELEEEEQDEELGGAEVDEVEDDDIIVSEEESEEELVDTVALEEEELRRDAKALEERIPVADVDD